ncbi:MAG: hypothetical protein KBT03_13040 [Bacteroidales bacterium]|nr:hypothetical protein [Candidatus Scybalousia scybalohippi]
MKKHDVILHIVNNTFDSVLVEYVNKEFCDYYPTFETFKAFQKLDFHKTLNVVEEIRYNSFEDSELWISDLAFDAIP